MSVRCSWWKVREMRDRVRGFIIGEAGSSKSGRSGMISWIVVMRLAVSK